jgi:hypothetical protein
MDSHSDMKYTLYRWHRKTGKDKVNEGAVGTSMAWLIIVLALIFLGAYGAYRLSPELLQLLKPVRASLTGSITPTRLPSSFPHVILTARGTREQTIAATTRSLVPTFLATLDGFGRNTPFTEP